MVEKVPPLSRNPYLCRQPLAVIDLSQRAAGSDVRVIGKLIASCIASMGAMRTRSAEVSTYR
jgi:hypothetical protein